MSEVAIHEGNSMALLGLLSGVVHVLLALPSDGKAPPPAHDYATLEIKGTLMYQEITPPYKPILGGLRESFTVLVDQGKDRRVRWTLELPSDRKLAETAKGLNGKKVIVVGEPVFPYWMSEEGLSTFRRGYLRAYEPAMRVRSIRPPIPADNEGRSPENAKECPP